MKYGQFNKEGTEYHVTEPLTPRPWINYLTNEEYCAIISQCAGGYSFYDDCGSNRLMRWLPENWEFDRPGRYVFARDVDSKKTWSLSYQPIRASYQNYLCRHGFGYTDIEMVHDGIESKVQYFVPRQDTCEVWKVSVKNTSKKTRTLELFPYVEWMIGDYHLELRYRNILNLYNRVSYEKSSQIIWAQKTATWDDFNIQPFVGSLFFASSLPATGQATQKLPFLGRCNTEATPAGIREGGFVNTDLCSGEDSIACLRHRLKLAPGQSKTWTVVMGQAESAQVVRKLVKKYRQIPLVDKERAAVIDLWRRRMESGPMVQTPDHDFDVIINRWVKYQTYICNLWSRSPSYYHEGSGGRGFRDSCQDAEGIMSVDSDHARAKIIRIAKVIREDGTCAPGWTDSGPQGHRPNKDHPVWLTSTVSAYIKETGDWSILKMKLPFLRDRWIKGWEVNQNWKGGPIQVGEATLFEHLWRNLHFTFHDVGERGLPKIGHADWNDAIDAAGIKHKGESVWLALALVRSLKILAELAERTGETEKARELRRRTTVMTERIEKTSWDGQWYKRGFRDDGIAYGTSKEKEGRIFMESQSFAVMSGVAQGDRLKKVLSSVDKHLDGKYGYALFYPAYSKWNKALGRISMFSEGTKENAAVFCHMATFMAIGNCMAGRGTKAYEAMRKIMPSVQPDYELYKTEPYVYSEYLVGPENPTRYGEGAFTWITGTAAWTLIAATEWLLGARRDYDGLLIDPCIPAHWKHCSIRRPFRGAVYDIKIENPLGVEKGVSYIEVDGRRLDGVVLPAYGDGRTHAVRVVMGQPRSSGAANNHLNGSARLRSPSQSVRSERAR